MAPASRSELARWASMAFFAALPLVAGAVLVFRLAGARETELSERAVHGHAQRDAGGAVAVAADDEHAMAESIRLYFEDHRHGLSLNNRAHFATRLYRTRQDPRYTMPIALSVVEDIPRIVEDVNHIDDPVWMAQRYERRFEALGEGTARKLARKNVWARFKRETYDHSLLSVLYRWTQFGLRDSALGPTIQGGVDYLDPALLAAFYLDPEALRAQPTKSVNGVYYLYWMGLGDWRLPLKDAIEETFVAHVDTMGEDAFSDMVYGLTHVVVGQSNYYQQFVDEREVQWVLDLLRLHEDRIVSDCSEDIVAEAGLAFVLAQVEPERTPGGFSARLFEVFDEERGYIPRTDHDLNSLEHRNAVSYLFLSRPQQLYGGPDLSGPYRELIAESVGAAQANPWKQ